MDSTGQLPPGEGGTTKRYGDKTAITMKLQEKLLHFGQIQENDLQSLMALTGQETRGDFQERSQESLKKSFWEKENQMSYT